MGRRDRPGLDPDDRAAWAQVAATVRPLRAPKATPAPRAVPAEAAAAPPPAADVPPPALVPFAIGASVAPGPATRIDLAPPEPRGALDRRMMARLARGMLVPEARLDLHGLTLAEAQPALARFILAAQAQGRRLVLVITGKGRTRDDGGPIPPPAGALRRQVPVWLAAPPLAGAVLGTAEAHRRHGGAGALYVALRRLRPGAG